MYLIRQLKDWLKTSQAAKNSFYFLSLLSLLILSTQSNQVLAQETGGNFPFTPTDGDLSIKLIGKLFGGLVEIIGGTNGGDPFGGAIGAFNGAVLAVGGILAAYTIFAGTVGTAHDGEMMGKKFSSAWVPIRTALGSALVLPVFGGGYCAMQAIVMWLVFQGVGLADTTWAAYVKSNVEGGGIYESLPVAPDAQELAGNILKASTCYKAMALAATKVGDTQIIPKNWGISKNESSRTMEFGVIDGIDNKNICGDVSYGSLKNPIALVQHGLAANELVSQPGSGIIQGVVNAATTLTSMAPIYAAQEKATKNLIDTIQPLADKIVANIDVKSSEMDAAISAYQKTIIVAAIAVQNSVGASPFEKIKNDAKKQGWFLAGAWYMKIVTESNKMGKAVRMIPSSSGATSRIDTKASYMQDAAPAIYRAELITAKIKKNQETALLPGESNSWWTTTWDWVKNPADKAMSVLTDKIVWMVTSVDLKTLNENKKHPIIIMNAMGNNLIASATGLIAVVTVLAGALGVGATVGTNIVLALMPLATAAAGAMAVSGFMLSYYIPMVPLLIWTGAVLGWVILVVEAIIAAPLWAVMHLHPHGDDLTGKGGGGYMLVLGLLIRPVLMIFGLIASLTIVQVFGEMLNTIYYDSLTIAYGSESQFLGLIFGIIIYVALMTTFIQKSFSIIHIIPDQLLKWIGGGSEQLGQYAGEFNKSGQGAATAIGGFVGKEAGAAGQRAAQGIRDGRIRDNENKKVATQKKADHDADMDNKVPGMSESLDRAGKAAMEQKQGAMGNNLSASEKKFAAERWNRRGEEARRAESEKFTNLERIGGVDAAMDYAKRTKDLVGKGKTQDEATKEAYDKTRSDFLGREFGKEGAEFINSVSDNGKNTSEERSAISAARRVVGIAKNQNNAQETFKQANEKENLSDKKNHIKDIINSGALAKEESKSNATESPPESQGVSRPEMDESSSPQPPYLESQGQPEISDLPPEPPGLEWPKIS